MICECYTTNMDQSINPVITQQILPLARKYLNLSSYRLVLFGSRANNTASTVSDIDIGILGSQPVPRQKLALLRDALRESPTIYKIDLVDLATTSESFRNLAVKNGYPIPND